MRIVETSFRVVEMSFRGVETSLLTLSNVETSLLVSSFIIKSHVDLILLRIAVKIFVMQGSIIKLKLQRQSHTKLQILLQREEEGRGGEERRGFDPKFNRN